MKEILRKRFSGSYQQHYMVGLFREKGFERASCVNCGKFFWSLDRQRRVCGDSSCQEYGFIGKHVAKSYGYVDAWKAIERFFVKNGHVSIQRYPVICRWFPGLYFTIAGIVAFQRLSGNDTVFEVPANPVILPQLSLRFNDIPNVGVTGRHYTSFVMVQQTAIYNGRNGYWKDRCIDLDYKLLTEVFGIKEEEITFVEDVWVGPNAFGPSLEYFAHGLELGNAVFTQFLGTADSFSEMSEKVIDMGAGLERFVWLASGAYSSYDPVFGPVAEWMRKKAGIRDSRIFEEYAVLAGKMDFDSTLSMAKRQEMIAKQLGVTRSELMETVSPRQAIYAIADHAKTLLFALVDGGIPSNVGGGYNLRVVLRRALNLIEEYGFSFDLEGIARMHAEHLAPMYPELRSRLGSFSQIVQVEKERYKETLKNASKLVASLPEKPSEEKLISLYVSNGVTPEIIEAESKRTGRRISVPDDFYARLTRIHESEKAARDALPGIPKDTRPTRLGYYEDRAKAEFSATVAAVAGDYVVLDQTFFYPEGGGQAADSGEIAGIKVADVQKHMDIVFHRLAKNTLKPGQAVSCKVDMGRRKAIMRHHTAIHILNGSARKVIGEHIWQAGSSKTDLKASLDVTHFRPFTGGEIADIEGLANKTISRGLEVKKHVMPRPLAEQAYTLRIYQGGVIPLRTLRIIEIPGFDVEACGGLHLDNTADALALVITGHERIKDGVNRLEIVAGERAIEFLARKSSEADAAARICERFVEFPGGFAKRFGDGREAFRQLKSMGSVFGVPADQVNQTLERFAKDIGSVAGQPRPKAADMGEAAERIFSIWKQSRKAGDALREKLADESASQLIDKAKDGSVVQIIAAGRQDLIKTASALISGKAGIDTVVLANKEGDMIVMSRKHDSRKLLAGICSKCSGSGGGRPEFAQGKVDPEKFNAIKDKLKISSG